MIPVVESFDIKKFSTLSNYNKYLEHYYLLYKRHMNLCGILNENDFYYKEYKRFITKLDDVTVYDEFLNTVTYTIKYNGVYVIQLLDSDKYNSVDIYIYLNRTKIITKLKESMVLMMMKYYLENEHIEKEINIIYC